MSQEIINYLVALIPSLTAGFTVIISVASMVKELKSKTNSIKNNITSFSAINEECKKLMQENSLLKEKLDKLLAEVISQNILLERLNNLEAQYQDFSSKVESTISSELKTALIGVEQVKSDLRMLGELTEDESNESKN